MLCNYRANHCFVNPRNSIMPPTCFATQRLRKAALYPAVLTLSVTTQMEQSSLMETVQMPVILQSIGTRKQQHKTQYYFFIFKDFLYH
jgi:hypothetical protein